MDIKQEPADLIEDQVVIKQEKDDIPPIECFQKTYTGKINEIIVGADNNYDLVQTNNTKKGLSINGRSIKKENLGGRIFLCTVCGYMCTKKVELFCHFSRNHFFNQRNLFKTKINRKYNNKVRSQLTYREVSIGADVKNEIEIVDHELEEELDQIEDRANLLKNIKDLKRVRYCYKTDNNHVKCKMCLKDSQLSKSVNRLCQIDGKSLEPECCLDKHLSIGEKPDVSYIKQKRHFNRNLCTHTSEKPFKCNVCTKSFSHGATLKVHLRTHTGEKPFKCNVCTKSFSVRSNLKIHLGTHNDEKLFKCTVCTKSFSVRGNLKSHLRTHNGEKPFQCNFCTKSFSLGATLKGHLRTHTGEKPFNCIICTKSFSVGSYLKRHLRTHTGEKPFKCDVCTKSFSVRSNLKSHLRTHTGEKPFKCDVCTKSFSVRSYLMIHLRTHNGEKPFECNVCTISFSRGSTLKLHLRTHTGENPYKCDVCTKSFSRKDNFKEHLRTHTGEKPFKCNVCTKSFSRNYNLKQHLRSHTDEKTIQM